MAAFGDLGRPLDEDALTFELCLRLLSVLRGHEDALLLPVASCTRPLFGTLDKPDMIFCARDFLSMTQPATAEYFLGLMDSCKPASKKDGGPKMPSFASVCVVGEGKLEIAGPDRRSFSAAGKEAVGQLMLRFWRMRTSPSYGFVYDLRGVLFVRFENFLFSRTEVVGWEEGGWGQLCSLLLCSNLGELGWSGMGPGVRELMCGLRQNERGLDMLVPLLPARASDVDEGGGRGGNRAEIYFAPPKCIFKSFTQSVYREQEKEVLDHLRKQRVPRVPRCSRIDSPEGDGRWLLKLEPCLKVDLEVGCGHIGSRELMLAFEDIARTLVATHRAGVVHCDVKPSNVVWSKARGAYLIDWEMAYWRGKRGRISGGTHLFSAVDQVLSEASSFSPEPLWDWQSFLFSAFYCLTHRHLPWYKAEYEEEPEDSGMTRVQFQEKLRKSAREKKIRFLDADIDSFAIENDSIKKWVSNAFERYQSFRRLGDENVWIFEK